MWQEVVEVTKQRRHRFQLYYEILSAVELVIMNEGNAKPTRVQHLSNMSYDRLKRHFVELDKTGLLSTKDGAVFLTDKGRDFLRNYNQLTNIMHAIGFD